MTRIREHFLLALILLKLALILLKKWIRVNLSLNYYQ